MSDTNSLDAPLEAEKTPVELVAEHISPQTTDTSKEPMPEFASNYLPLNQFYGIENMTQEDQTKLQAIWQHFTQDAKTPSTVLKKIKMEHHNMVQPNIGESRLQQMYNYVRLLQDINEAQEMKKVYRNDTEG